MNTNRSSSGPRYRSSAATVVEYFSSSRPPHARRRRRRRRRPDRDRRFGRSMTDEDEDDDDDDARILARRALRLGIIAARRARERKTASLTRLSLARINIAHLSSSTPRGADISRARHPARAFRRESRSRRHRTRRRAFPPYPPPPPHATPRAADHSPTLSHEFSPARPPPVAVSTRFSPHRSAHVSHRRRPPRVQRHASPSRLHPIAISARIPPRSTSSPALVESSRSSSSRVDTFPRADSSRRFSPIAPTHPASPVPDLEQRLLERRALDHSVSRGVSPYAIVEKSASARVPSVASFRALIFINAFKIVRVQWAPSIGD